METCPTCFKSMDPQKNLYQRSFMQMVEGDEPERRGVMGRIGRHYVVRCPACGCTHVSREVRRFFGLLTYRRHIALLVVATLAGFALATWGGLGFGLFSYGHIALIVMVMVAALALAFWGGFG